MRPGLSPVIVVPGASNLPLDLRMLVAPDDAICFKTIVYPGWQRFVDCDFSVDLLVGELALQIATIVPTGPIRILGFSIGGHFGYAAALLLQACGREIVGFCAIDSFMVDPLAQQTPAQKGNRVLARLFSLLRDGRLRDSSTFVRSSFYRAMVRSAGGRLPNLLRSLAPSGRLPPILARDQLFAEEARMHLLIRQTEPWIRSLDVEPIALRVPSILFRTRESGGDDGLWRGRCPDMEICEIPGDHRSVSDVFENSRNLKTTFAPKNIGAIRASFLKAMRS
jgi:pimeloyl-ACP methyl ester carboxylesterase